MLTKFVLSKELFIFERTGNVYQYYEFTGEKLGEGGFAEVVKVKEKATGHVRAAKKILRTRIKNYERFMNEISALKTWDHPNIVKLYEVFEEKDWVFLIQEYLAGGELFDYITDNDHLSEKEASFIFSQIIKSLIYCHEKKLTHRDLKPENFMFKSKEKGAALKLIDFGYAKKFQKDPKDHAGQFERMKSRVGTENYLAPEILKRNYSHSCDVWAAGVILYIMLCGCPPFEGDDEDETFKLIENIEYDFDDELFISVSEEAKDLISKILTPESERLTLQEVLEHPWIKHNDLSNSGSIIDVNLTDRLRNFTKATKLRKAVATLIATQVSDQDISEVIKTFNSIDKNMDGYITLDELERGMAMTSIDERKAIMGHVDTDKNNAINYNEFIAATLHDKNIKNSFSINRAFDFFDIDKDGVIEKEELKTILQNPQFDKMETNIIMEMILEADLNGDGKIDKSEFKRCLSYKKNDFK